MTMYVLVQNEPEGKYTASVIGLPGIVAQAATEDEALRQLRQSLTRQLAGARIVPIEVNLAESDNPWLQMAGMFKADPFAEDLQTAITAYRSELDSADEQV